MKGKDGDRTSGSVWQEFLTNVKGCSIFMKVDSNKIDLEFAKMGPRLDELNELLKKYDLPPAIRTKKGKSQSASIEVMMNDESSLSFYYPFVEQEERVVTWMEAIIKLMDIVKTLHSNGINSFPL